ncbi:ABC transporter ATP-binding protein [Actinoplanes sp. ATCC 53533]|uniref:ABC transporter ATP-binding protein n=1 Tax=Actinoplanes sp. ATCC 53533 TaxID=1288362 RepID=UPI000F796755|nr:ATP-binding cassette domain-containing protein [Actinoplanes sp. ATCC 53533]RSM65395.1 ABC transporter ATP-binding protein [Actinoplanes sp. ATCC 53533]
MIELSELTKSYGRVRAVDGVTFSAAPGRVTGFLGLNGSGKTTTLRMLLGLTRPTSGAALINKVRFQELRHPARQVGAVLEQGISHPGQSGRAHLTTQALLSGADRARVDPLLEQVGLGDAAEQRCGDYSLGMRQRLAVATALLGDPSVLILDEPANGLDPEGIAWLRELLREHARGGGTVLISSHLLAELAQLIDDVVIISEGTVRYAAPLDELYGSAASRLRIRGRDPQLLWQVFEEAGAQVDTDGSALEVTGLTPEEAGELAFDAQVPLYELTTDAPNLEQIFLGLVNAPASVPAPAPAAVEEAAA